MNAAERIDYRYWKNPHTGVLDSLNFVLQEDQLGSPIFRTGHPQSYGARVQGGTEMLRYYVSSDFDRDEGIVDYNWRNRLSLRSNLEIVPNEKLNVKVDVGFTHSRTRFGGSANIYGLMEQMNFGSPDTTYDKTRGFFRVTPDTAALIQSFEELDRGLASIQIQHTPNPWFSQRLVVGADLGDANSSVLYPRDKDGAKGPFLSDSEGDATLDRRKVTYTSLDYSANARFSAGSNLQFTTSVGAQYYAKHFYTANLKGHGFPDADNTVLAAAATTSAAQERFANKTAGLYLQEEIGLNNRVFITGAVRSDDNSAFGANFDFVTYPRLSLSWVMSEEPFWHVPFISALQMRAAFGTAGQQPDVYAAERTYQPSSGQQGPTITPKNIGNPDLKPERGQELEIGFDAGLWRDRVAVNFTHYEQRTRDAILGRRVAASTGFPDTQFVNIGLVRNWGDELGVDARVLERPSLAVSLGSRSHATRIEWRIWAISPDFT